MLGVQFSEYAHVPPTKTYFPKQKIRTLKRLATGHSIEIYTEVSLRNTSCHLVGNKDSVATYSLLVSRRMVNETYLNSNRKVANAAHRLPSDSLMSRNVGRSTWPSESGLARCTMAGTSARRTGNPSDLIRTFKMREYRRSDVGVGGRKPRTQNKQQKWSVAIIAVRMARLPPVMGNGAYFTHATAVRRHTVHSKSTKE